MFGSHKSRILLSIADLLGTLALGVGIFLVVYGLADGYFGDTIYGSALAGVGFTWLVVVQIGRAIVHIAETNSAVLAAVQSRL